MIFVRILVRLGIYLSAYSIGLHYGNTFETGWIWAFGGVIIGDVITALLKAGFEDA